MLIISSFGCYIVGAIVGTIVGVTTHNVVAGFTTGCIVGAAALGVCITRIATRKK